MRRMGGRNTQKVLKTAPARPLKEKPTNAGRMMMGPGVI
jgi:hypothetical protein